MIIAIYGHDDTGAWGAWKLSSRLGSSSRSEENERLSLPPVLRSLPRRSFGPISAVSSLTGAGVGAGAGAGTGTGTGTGAEAAGVGTGAGGAVGCDGIGNGGILAA